MKKFIPFLCALVMLVGIQHPAQAKDNKDHQYTAKEIKLIARVVYAEARGESWEGKLAVAAVVINRHRNSDTSVKKIVFAKNQFSVSRDYSTKKNKTMKKCVEAVEYLLDNEINPLPSNTYYFRTSGRTWRTFSKYCKIGHHYFYTAGKPKWLETDEKFTKSGELKTNTTTNTNKNITIDNYKLLAIR